MEGIRQALKERILILDGAMGTMLQRRGLQGNSESFNLSAPSEIGKIHDEYIEAGADIITTNSFGASRISQAELGHANQAADMAEASARIARAAAERAGRKVWVAGSVGPTGKSLSLAQDIGNPAFRPYSFDQMAEAFEEQIRALLRGGVDIILLETCFDALNTKAAIYALNKILDGRIPGSEGTHEVMVSVSLGDRSGRTLTGQTIEAFYRSITHCHPLSFGLNCSLGASELIPAIGEVSGFAECAVSCHPNAGLPDEMGNYSESPEETADAIRQMAINGYLNIAGGCCGTTPEHIRAIATALKGLPSRIGSVDRTLNRPLYVSGLESVEIDLRNNFTNVGERTNVAGSRKFARLIASQDYETALQVASDQIENGASVIDINMDDAMLDSAKEMETFLRHISGEPSVAKAAIMIDSSHWETILTGLKNAQGKCIVNSISLKEGEEIFIQKAKEIRALGGTIIVIAFDEQGQATTYSRKIEICRRAYSLLTDKAGIRPEDIIFDVNVLPIGTGIPEHERYGIDFIEAVRWIKNNLPCCRTSGGISNLSFSFRGNNIVREAMHSVFLYHAVNAGLDMGIVNPGMLKVYDDIDPVLLKHVEDVILAKDPGATERLISFASSLMEASSDNKSSQQQATDSSRTEPEDNLPAGERLTRSLVKGESRTLETDILECLKDLGRPVDVIDGPLMKGMERVGELFGAGKMFLPQVVKSAKVMKNAVDILQPYMSDGMESGKNRPRILMATVKGDVHDIGKNITGIVLSCNGFEVIDLGVMVPKETILQRAEECRADLIGVSGLITPSLYQMEELCKEMTSRKLTTPLLVGGAAASALHTAVKLAPLYGHVFYGADASSSAVLARELMNDRTTTERKLHGQQEKLRSLHEESKKKSSDEKVVSPFPADSFIKGDVFMNIPARELGISDVEPYFDWNLFYAIWGLKAGKGMMERRKLRADAARELDLLKAEGGVKITIAARFDQACSKDDTIVTGSYSLPMMRQKGGRSLCDFVPPGEYGFTAQMGMFAVSVHQTAAGNGAEGLDPDEMLSRSVRLTLAEAASEWLSHQLESKLPQGCGAKIIKPAAGYSSCPDHTLKRDILSLLPDSPKLGITLLESCAMIPDASICGLIFIHPEASYPEIRRLPDTAIDEYAARRGMSQEEKARFLGHLL